MEVNKIKIPDRAFSSCMLFFCLMMLSIDRLHMAAGFVKVNPISEK